MYFETGQGSALSADAHHGVDQQTLEARAYAVARAFKPLLVNTVVGFIGPEYLYDGKQIIRAGLEDHFCGKLLGLPMGCDVCYTNHAEADQDDMDTLLTLLGAAGVTYVMGVPGADDVMLNYQSTSFHDAALRARGCSACGARPSSKRWLAASGLDRRAMARCWPSRRAGACFTSLAEAGGMSTPDARGRPCAASPRRASASAAPARRSRSREVLRFAMAHAQARDAVHADRLGADREEPAPSSDSTRAGQPPDGEPRRRTRLRICAGPISAAASLPKARERLAASRAGTAPRYLLLVVADGSSSTGVAANATRCHRRAASASRARAAGAVGRSYSPAQGRVALGDEPASCSARALTLVLIGERPGLSSPDSLGAYLTYAPRAGRKDGERNCVSNIRRAGLAPSEAAARAAWLVEAAFARGLSGVALKDESASSTPPRLTTDAI